MRIKYSLITLVALSSINAEEVSLEAVSVTATKIATATKDVSVSIAVVDEQTIEDKNMAGNIFSKIGKKEIKVNK